MSEPSSPKYTALLPFDITYGERFSMYYKIPYYRNLDLLNTVKPQLTFESFYKYYKCAMVEPIKIGGDTPKIEESIKLIEEDC